MNWGTRLIIGMLSFIVFIVILGIIMMRSETDALIDTNYYEKGLKYDKEYLQKEQVIKDNALPTIQLLGQDILITFKTEASGSLKIIRMAKKSMDRLMDFNTGNNKTLVLKSHGLARGQWKFILQWKNIDGSAYLNEQEILIP